MTASLPPRPDPAPRERRLNSGDPVSPGRPIDLNDLPSLPPGVGSSRNLAHWGPDHEALRYLADAIRELAAAIRGPAPEVPAGDDSPGPANGLITQVRPSADYRPRGAARRPVGFNDWDEQA